MNDRKLCVVSGGSRGLGAAIVADRLARGDVVATFSRSRTPFIEQCSVEHRERFRWAKVDATDWDAMRLFVEDTENQHGHIDALVNNAAIGLDGVLPLARADDIHRTLAVNLESTIRLIQLVSRAMLRKGGGTIVNVTSVNGIRGNSGVAVYSATKAALDGLTRSLARELGERDIRVNSIAPGYFDSEMSEGMADAERAKIVRRTPLGRLASMDEILGPIRFLLSDDAKFVTGHVLVVDGGLTC